MGKLLDFKLIQESTRFDLYKLSGELDKAGLLESKDEMEAAIDFYKKESFAIDISELKFINSEGIGFLMSLHAHLKTNQSKLVLMSPMDNVLDVFDAIGLTQIIKIAYNISQI